MAVSQTIAGIRDSLLKHHVSDRAAFAVKTLGSPWFPDPVKKMVKDMANAGITDFYPEYRWPTVPSPERDTEENVKSRYNHVMQTEWGSNVANQRSEEFC